MIAIKTADLTQNFKSIADRIDNGEKALISRPHNKNLVILREEEYRELEEMRKVIAGQKLKEVFKRTRKQAVANGTSELSLDSILTLIAEEKR